MSQLRDQIEQVRSLLKEWDDGDISTADFDSKLDDITLNPILARLEDEGTFIRFGSCCCYSHPPDRTFNVSITIQPHGFTIKKLSSQ